MTEPDLRAAQVREELKAALEAAYRGEWDDVDTRLADCRLMIGTMVGVKDTRRDYIPLVPTAPESNQDEGD